MISPCRARLPRSMRAGGGRRRRRTVVTTATVPTASPPPRPPPPYGSRRGQMMRNPPPRWWTRRFASRSVEIRSCLTTVSSRAYPRPTRRRLFSSSSLDDVHALPFSISPQQARDKFERWADEEQGLSYLRWSSVHLTAAYCPVWSFALNLRFAVTDAVTGRRRLDWKPDTLRDAYGRRQSIVHLPGPAAYAGYRYRRDLVDAVHGTSLIFLRDDLVPFGPWMLDAMRDDGRDEMLRIDPDPWNATRRRALAVVREQWQALATGDYRRTHPDADDDDVTVQIQVVSSRRVYMPTYVLEYRILPGVAYQAFVSGADRGADVSGVSHRLWEEDEDSTAAFTTLHRTSRDALRTLRSTFRRAGRVLGPRSVAVILVSLVRFGVSVAGRFLLRVPPVAGAVATWIGFRKVVWPYWTQRRAEAAWTRERDAPFADDDGGVRADDFVDATGTAERFFQRHREAILRTLAGEEQHDKGDFDWYQDWMEWARRMYEQERRGYGQQQQQQQRTSQKTRPREDYQWDFDPDDPYSVLKISRNADSKEISRAFRREMLRYHPDTQTHATPAARERATERSKIISEAYQKLKKTR